MKKLATVTGILLLVAVFAYPVFAWGPGWGGMHKGMGHGGGHGPGWCWRTGAGYGALTPEQQTQLNQLRQKFFDETTTLRSDLWAKQGELNSLLNTPNPDQSKVKQLQDEVNDLRAKLSHKRLDFQLKAKKITPNAGPGPGMYGGGPGYGMNRGSYGPGHCWN